MSFQILLWKSKHSVLQPLPSTPFFSATSHGDVKCHKESVAKNRFYPLCRREKHFDILRIEKSLSANGWKILEGKS